MLLLKLEQTSREPVFRQIINQLRILIDDGAITEGERLPPTRKLAQQLGVNRSTVCRAYDELWALGYTESTPGGYSLVRKRRFSNKALPPGKCEDWVQYSCFTAGSDALHSHFEDVPQLTELSPATVNFRPLSPDPRLMPVEAFRKKMNQVMNPQNAALLQYADVSGYLPLRRLLATQLRQHGISASEDEILLTDGTQNALDLLFRLLAGKSSRIVVEEPTYAAVLLLLKLFPAEVETVPMTEEGMDLAQLEKVLAKPGKTIVYTMPSFHNPTGTSSSQAHREKLLQLCQQYGSLVLEDGFEEEMKYFGKAVQPIKSIDRKGHVIYLGTFSKILFPGVRVGWIVAPAEIANRLRQIRQATQLAANHLVQAGLCSFWQSGEYELHKKRVHRIYRKRMQTAMLSARTYLPTSKISYTKPNGGYVFWLKMAHASPSETELLQLFLNQGVAVTAGSSCFLNKPQTPCFRISIAHLDEPAIAEGLKRIGLVLNSLQ